MQMSKKLIIILLFTVNGRTSNIAKFVKWSHWQSTCVSEVNEVLHPSLDQSP